MKLPIQFSVRDLLKIAKDPTITVSSTPFGADLEKEGKQLVVKKAVPWKGVKGVENVKKINRRVGETIEKLAKASKMLSGEDVKGTVVVAYKGKITMMPYKSYLMAKLAGKPIEKIEDIVPVSAFRTDVDTYVSNVTAFAKGTAKAI